MTNNTYTSIRLQQFRSYNDFAVELSPGVNIVVGPNASGKTNLLESILLVSGSSSYRAQFVAVIEHTKDWARIDGILVDSTRTIKVQKNNEILEKSYEINTKVKKRLSFEDILPTVLFEPEHMRLLTGSPDMRREFLDAILSETDPSFNTKKNHYKRALAQRNKLLKLPQTIAKNQIFAWNIRLSELAGFIVTKRLGLIEELNKKISKTYSEIANQKTSVNLTYESSIRLDSYESSLLKKLEQNLEQDLIRGFTAHGPHREDLIVSLRGLPASDSASRGETRTLVLSLKLLELGLIEQARGQKPLILLDDVFSELDGSRRQALTHYLNNYQTIITTTDADVIAKNFAQASNLISLV
jgi:DNA replication and repair protein RecF